ncbi:MAG: quinone-dependent dihydroorotate dehydrogenase [Anaerolineaceae bacterium]|nr:quinone-dependent dihydroorotate dehydrogenase [Anaerolineaceae bacterium]
MHIYPTLRPFIYLLSPRQAHTFTITLLRAAGSLSPLRALVRALFKPKISGQQVEVLGLTFPNTIGLAAGYDKDGLGWRGLACLGFGHLELGTVTPLPQPGNPEPRIFRLVEDNAVINRMGFPNLGADFMVRRLRGPRPKGLILGMNIGKNKDTPLEEAERDYLPLVKLFAPLVDYLTVNVSSPNTPGLRELQSKKMLDDLLFPIAKERKVQVEKLGRPVPILVKLAPDLNDSQLHDALEAVTHAGMDGVIIANTTLRREDLHSRLADETGGLSGAPLNDINTAMVKKTAEFSGGKMPIIASGGVMKPSDAQAKMDAGAALVQLYTGLIYEGPGLVRAILDKKPLK